MTTWSISGRKILAPDSVSAIAAALQRGPIVVLHWHFAGARHPDYVCFENLDDFHQYAMDQALPGDAFDVWSLAGLCVPENRIAEGKIADAEGRVPIGGSY